MKNAHERFGWLEFDKQLRDTRTRIRVALDRFIGEPAEAKEASGVCHLVSVFGNDVDIGAIWAALHPGVAAQDGFGGGAYQTFSPVATFSAYRPPPASGPESSQSDRGK